MKKIKTLLRSLTISSNYDKALLKLDSSDEYAVPTQEVINSIQEGIDGMSIEISQDKATKDFFVKLTKHSQHWSNAIKLLVISQNLLHSMKLNFAFKFLDHETQNIPKTAFANNSPSDELHIEIALKYCEFIRGMCRSFKCVYECEQFAENASLQYLGLKPLQDILDTLTPLIGILKNLFRIQQSLSFSLQNFQKYTIIKEVARLMIRDSTMIYNFLANVTSKLTEKIIRGEKQESLSIYSVYEDVAMLTKTMEKFYQLRYFTVGEQASLLNKPQYMIIDIEKNRAIELHINRLKGSNKGNNNNSQNASSLDIDIQKNAQINNFLAVDSDKSNDQKITAETALNSIQIKQKNKLFSDKNNNNNNIGLFSSSAVAEGNINNHNIFGVTSQLEDDTSIPTKDIQHNNFFSKFNKPIDPLENTDQSRKKPKKFFLSQNKKLDFDGDTNSNSSGGFLERQSTKNVQSLIPDDYERDSIFSQCEVNSNILSSCQAMNNNNTPSFVSRNFRKQSQPESAMIRMTQQANME